MRSATAGRTRMAARVGSQHATACESAPKARVSRLISVACGPREEAANRDSDVVMERHAG